MAFTASVP